MIEAAEQLTELVTRMIAAENAIISEARIAAGVITSATIAHGAITTAKLAWGAANDRA